MFEAIFGTQGCYPRSGELYHIVPRHAPDKVLGVKGNGSNNGAELVLWDRDGRPNQTWRVEARGKGTFSFVPLHAQDKKLDANNGVGHNCHLWDSSNPYNENQLFRLQPTDSDFFLVLRACDGAVIDVEYAATQNGAHVHTWGKVTGNPNQQWRFVPAGAPQDSQPRQQIASPLQGVGGATIQIHLQPGHSVSWQTGPEMPAKVAKTHHSQPQPQSDHRQQQHGNVQPQGHRQQQRGNVQPQGHRQQQHGNVQHQGHGQQQHGLDQQQHGPRLEDGGLYQIHPRSIPGKVVGVQGNNAQNGSALVLWDPDGLPNQTWRAEQRGRNLWSFVPMHARDKRLDANNGVGQDCHIWDCSDPNNQNQIWRVKPIDHGYHLLFRASDNAVLDVAKHATHNGANLHTWRDVTKTPNQQFSFSRVG